MGGVTPLNTNLLKDQNISLIVIFLIILITFPFDDVVMLLGENRCGSLKGERGLIREVTLGEEGWLINQVGPRVPPDLYSTQEGHPS